MQEVFEKIIEQLESKAIERYEKKGMGRQTDIDYDDAIEIFRQTAAEYNNGWIPRSEQLPTESDKYNDELYPMCLVTIESGETCLGVFRYDVNKWYTKMFCGENNYSTERNVIAWQPLAEPYEET